VPGAVDLGQRVLVVFDDREAADRAALETEEFTRWRRPEPDISSLLK
jgi:hypothetical protein